MEEEEGDYVDVNEDEENEMPDTDFEDEYDDEYGNFITYIFIHISIDEDDQEIAEQIN